METRLLAGPVLPESDGALMRALDRCKDGREKGPLFTFAIRNASGETYRHVVAAGFIEASRVAQEVAKVGYTVDRAFDAEPADGIHGAYRAPL